MARTKQNCFNLDDNARMYCYKKKSKFSGRRGGVGHPSHTEDAFNLLTPRTKSAVFSPQYQPPTPSPRTAVAHLILLVDASFANLLHHG